MSVAIRQYDRYYPTSLGAGYVSSSVSPASEDFRSADAHLKNEASATVRESQPKLFAAVWDISRTANESDWDGEGAQAIKPETVTAAVQLICALPEGLQPPVVTPEPTGEISFEWYRSVNQIAVLTIQENIIRWSTFVGTGSPRHGREFFSRTIPGPALTDIQTVNA
ncbi:MAG TPA: hypothetical protein VJP80_08650 [Candidatus Saccharimonadales bacterium]|nr:hypothetical protein [Candidatus Saccharimonadales bacterium]